MSPLFFFFFVLSQSRVKASAVSLYLVYCSQSVLLSVFIFDIYNQWTLSGLCRGRSRGRVQGWSPRLPEMTCGFLTRLLFCKICRYVLYVFSAVHIMLLPSQKPSPSYSLLKFVYVTSQSRHSLVVHPLLRKILDSSLLCAMHMLSVPYCSAHRIQEMIA